MIKEEDKNIKNSPGLGCISDQEQRNRSLGEENNTIWWVDFRTPSMFSDVNWEETN
jgi:hypothetical protein